VEISTAIVTSLLDFTQPKPAKPIHVSTLEAVHQALEQVPPPDSVKVILDLPANLPMAYADAQHVVKILGNIIHNACQAMTLTGQATDFPSSGKLIIASGMREKMIYITVKDTGVGIPPENLDKLFEPLYTTRPQGIGFGLGLAVCKKLAEANGGRIEVESEEGHGSTFTLWLPIYTLH
jgi:signal transduction histidine kinase